MNRFAWVDPVDARSCLKPEEIVGKQSGVRLYDGEQKTPFDKGQLYLTSRCITWVDDQDQSCIMSLHLALIVLVEDQRVGSGRSPKIVLHLSSPPEKHSGVQISSADHIKLSFREGGMIEFSRRLANEIQKRIWESSNLNNQVRSVPIPRELRTGIAGIEKTLQAQQQTVNVQISKAFEDLNQLMKMAKETVNLSKILAAKVKSRQGEISDDETVQLKAYLLSLGVDDPVTRDVCGNDNVYHQKLAREISELLAKPIKESGGLMTLTDVYCRVNRARGFELVSPEDLLRACKVMASLKLSTQVKVFDSGVVTLELRDLSDLEIVSRTRDALDKEALTSEMLAKKLGMSVILAKEMLLLAEKKGLACRDESIEGLYFYPNLFVNR